MKRQVLLLVGVLVLSASASAQVDFLDEAFAYDHAHPAAGRWLGNVSAGRYPDTWGELVVERDVEGRWLGTITVLVAGALGSPCNELEVDGAVIAFTIGAAAGRFEGAVSPDGQRLNGTIRFPDAEAEGSFEFARTPRPMDLARPVAYTGAIEIPGMPAIEMSFVLAETPGGNLVGHADVPAQGLLGFPLINITRIDQTLTATLPVPVPGKLEVEIDAAESRLRGHFSQGPFDLEIDFSRDDAYTGPELNRPQHPEPPFPYVVREVLIEHPDGHVLAGTLTLPDEGDAFPAAIMITGSGPQDRDEQIFGHRPFLVIADYLTRRGLAVLRYDDRGTAQSTGTFDGATSEDFATDVMAAVHYLSALPEIDPTRIGLIGHSEGALIAPMVADLTDTIAFMVLLAGPGVRGDDLLRVQSKLILEASGADERVIESSRQQQEKVFGLVLADAEVEEIREALEPFLETELGAATGLDGEELQQLVEVQIRQLTSPWMRFFISYDPRPALRRVRCPVLALNGTLDLQVWHDQNLPEIEEALRAAGADVTIKRYENLNHLFQPAETGTLMEYAVIETTFDEAVLDDMARWIAARTEGLTDGGR